MSVCILCGKLFTQNVHNQKYCSTKCSEIAYRISHNKAVKKYNSKDFKIDYKPQQTIKPNLTLDDLVRECEVYNKLHGTRYSYGKYTALKRMGKV